MLRPRFLGHITTCCLHQCWAARRVTVACHCLYYMGRLLTQPVCMASITSSRTGCSHQTVWVWQSFPHPVLVIVIPGCWNSSGQSCEHGSVQSGFLSVSAPQAKCRSGLSCQEYTQKGARIEHQEQKYSGQELHKGEREIPAYTGMFGVWACWSFAVGLWRSQHVRLCQQDTGLYQNDPLSFAQVRVVMTINGCAICQNCMFLGEFNTLSFFRRL